MRVGRKSHTPGTCLRGRKTREIRDGWGVDLGLIVSWASVDAPSRCDKHLEFGREVAEVKHFIVAEEHRPLDHVSKLTDVSRPGV